MKKIILSLAVIALMTVFSANLMAQANLSSSAGAKLLTPITLTQPVGNTLHFGSLYKGGGGTCILNTSNSRSFTGTVTGSAVAPTSANAIYTVGGSANTTYAITLPATITVTEPVTVTTMSISTLTVKTSSGTEVTAVGATSTLDGTGVDGFIVGGTLTVGASQAAGVYSGTFNVTVAYN